MGPGGITEVKLNDPDTEALAEAAAQRLAGAKARLRKCTCPVEVIDIFEAEGWKSGARLGQDAMHFQATK